MVASSDMLRSILVGLESSTATSAAIDFGICWAKRFRATLVGLGVVDKPGICRKEPTGIGGSYYKKRSDDEVLADARNAVRVTLGNFARRCEAESVSHQMLEKEGQPDEQIVRESERFDIAVLGQNARFRFRAQNDDYPTLRQVLRGSSHPVVIVPENPSDGNGVVIAVDGSMQSGRALHDFVSNGLADGVEVHVVSVAADRLPGEEYVARAMDYLRLHNIPATSHVVISEKRAAKALLEKAAELQAGLIVAGAFGRGKLREFLFGSTTAALLETSLIPLFLCH